MAGVAVFSNAVIVHVLRRRAQGFDVLLLRRNKGDALDDFWLHVAGRIEPGETAWQAALRELREETGLSPQSFYTANHCEIFYDPSRDTLCMLPMFVAYVDAGQDVVLNDEHRDHAWVDIAEAMQMVAMENQRQCLAVLERSFINAAPPEFLAIKAA